MILLFQTGTHEANSFKHKLIKQQILSQYILIELKI